MIGTHHQILFERSKQKEMGEERSMDGRDKYMVLMGKPEERRPLGRPRGRWGDNINPLSAELNPICHLLALVGDLTFMGPCIVSISKYIFNKIQGYTVYLYLETALHISGGNCTHYQEPYNCIYSIWYLSYRYCYLPLS
jgi:hypothetical protein